MTEPADHVPAPGESDDSMPTQSSSGERKSPEEIRAEIEQTREELGDTVEALAAKTDVKARAQDRVEQAKQSATQLKDDVMAKAKQATPESAGAGAAQISGTVQERPLPFATAGAFAAGLLIGWLIGRRSD